MTQRRSFRSIVAASSLGLAAAMLPAACSEEVPADDGYNYNTPPIDNVCPPLKAYGPEAVPDCRAVGEECCCAVDCCSGLCLNGICAARCAGAGEACTVEKEVECCSHVCTANGCMCGPELYNACHKDADCCTGFCDPDLGMCQFPDSSALTKPIRGGMSLANVCTGPLTQVR